MSKHLRNGTLVSAVGVLLTISVACSGGDDDTANDKGTGNTGTGGTTGGKSSGAGKGGTGTGGTTGGSSGTASAAGGAGTTGSGGSVSVAGKGGSGGTGTAGTPASGGMSTTGGGGGVLAMAGGAGAPATGGMSTAGNGAGGIGAGGIGAGGSGAGGMPAAGNGAGGVTVGAMAAYHFDMASAMAGAAGAFDGTEGWAKNAGACAANVTVSQTTTQHAAGTGSLQIHFEGSVAGAAGAGGAAAGAAGAAGAAAGMGGAPAAMNVDCEIRRIAAPLETGKTITYSLYIPPDMGGSLGWVNVLIEAGASYTWVTLESVPAADLAKKGMWITRQVQVPVSATPPIQALGLQIGAPSTFTGDVYLDEVSW